MTEASEVSLLKKAFQVADAQGTGSFSRHDMSKVFMELGRWSQKDLDDLFNAAGVKDDTIGCNDFIDWMAEVADPAGNGSAVLHGEEDSDDDDGNALHLLWTPGPVASSALDLGLLVTYDVLSKTMAWLGADVTEAKAIYMNAERASTKRGEPSEHGVPLRDLLDDLEVNHRDMESLEALRAAVDAARRSRECPNTQLAVDVAASHVALSLRKTKGPADQAWRVLEQGAVVSHTKREMVLSNFKGCEGDFVRLVQGYMRSPPMVPPSAGRMASRQQCLAKVSDLIRRTGERFIDLEWDIVANPNPFLYVDKHAPGYDCTVGTPSGCRRLSDLIAKPMLFKGGACAGSIVQGQLGTGFLLGALGAIAAHSEDAIKKAFIKYDIGLGIFALRFWVDGEWTYTIVDDVMPLGENGQLLYARSSDQEEIWVSVLEKAYCKLHGCYEMCDGGRAHEAIRHICGGSGGQFAISAAHREDPTSYFALLQGAHSRGWLMTTEFLPQGAVVGNSKFGEVVLATGLFSGHVYYVEKLVQVAGQRLVRCRNPFGTGEWKGRFSDDDAFEEWTPELRAETGWTGERNSGRFWMALEDFILHSAGVRYSRFFGPEWKMITVASGFTQGDVQKAVAHWSYHARAKDELAVVKGERLDVLGKSASWWYGNTAETPSKRGFFPGKYVKLSDRPTARFDFFATPDKKKDAMSVVVMLMQPNVRLQRKSYKRLQDGLTYKDISYPDIQLMVIGPDGKVALKCHGRRSSMSGELLIHSSGQWKMYVVSVDGLCGDFTLRTYIKDGSAKLTAVDNAKASELVPGVTG